MAERALIIAIEEYPSATDGFTATTLGGTIAAARRFRAWLEQKWAEERKWAQSQGLPPEDYEGHVIFCSEPPEPGERGARRSDLIDALIDLQQQGRDQTGNFYFYFSGHGFRLAGEKIKLSDVLVAADFRDLLHSADCCFKLGAIVDGLRASLGQGCHYYFIDACRNEVPKAVASNVMPFDERGSGEPSTFVLQSTVAGAPALVAGPFARMLVEGLAGADHAKVWEPPATDHMTVRFDTLRRYLKEGLKAIQPVTQATAGEMGEAEAVLAVIRPVPLMGLSVVVTGLGGAPAGTIRVARFDEPVARECPLSSVVNRLDFPPNHYRVAVEVAGMRVTPAGFVDVDLYRDREVEFAVSAASGLESFAPRPEPAPPPAATVDVPVAPGTEVIFTNVETGEERTFEAPPPMPAGPPVETALPQGPYVAVLRHRGGAVIRREEVMLEGGTRVPVAPAAWQGSVPHESIAARFPTIDGGIDFSESLGRPVPDPDLSVWLAIIGGGRIVRKGLGDWGDYSKIGPLPMATFTEEPVGTSPVYLLAGLPQTGLTLSVGVSEADGRPEWQPAVPNASLPGVYEVVMRPPSGQVFVSLAVADQPVYTVASVASPNRCTLVVLTLDEEEQPRVAQYLLPIGDLMPHLSPRVQANLANRNQLRDIYTLALLHRAFRRRRRLDREFTEHEVDELLYDKWVDPIGASLAAYECVRRAFQPDLLRTAAVNMQINFDEVPDTRALLRLSGVDPAAPPNGVPLFLDGLRAFRDRDEWLPYPAGLVDFTGPWTAWRGAVERP